MLTSCPWAMRSGWTGFVRGGSARDSGRQRMKAASKAAPRRNVFFMSGPGLAVVVGGFLDTRRQLKTALFQERFDLGFGAGEIDEQADGVLAATAGEQRLPEAIAIFARQTAVLL